ncbi:MAG: hypothetical protein ABI821_04190 [Pseudomonadota bacterium]
MSNGPLEKIISDELHSNLKITLIDEAGELYARVSWIHWDSGFRDSGLAVEDRIVALNGAPLTLPDEPQARRNARDEVIGGLREAALFAEMGLKDGSPLTLTILRRNVPGRGWAKLDFTGWVRAERLYFTAAEKSAIAPGGPERLGRNDAGDSWMTWLERRVFEWECILDGRWLGKFDSRRLLAEHLELKPRIDAALAEYPGDFSKRLAEDWQRVADSLRGRAVTLPADALVFRDQSERIEKEIATAGDAAWDACLASNKAVDELPKVDLIRDDRAPIVGRVISLPGRSWRESVKDGDRSIFTASHSDYYCYIAADQPAMRAFWQMQFDYQARVEPAIQEKYDIIGRVAADTRLVVTERNGAKIGLNIEVLAVRVPGQFFADVTGAAKSFTGAELATARGAPPPPDDASPSDVMRAYVQATKSGDEKLWLAMYADWLAMGGDEEPPLYRAFDPFKNYMTDYTRARNLLLHKVSHVEPVWESEPRVVIRSDAFDGAPKVEQVNVIMDHIGPFEDGDHVFCSNETARLWQLQRRDGGPWRISSRNTL